MPGSFGMFLEQGVYSILAMSKMVQLVCYSPVHPPQCKGAAYSDGCFSSQSGRNTSDMAARGSRMAVLSIVG